MAMARAEIMSRSLARCPVRVMITVISFSGDAQRPFGRIGEALKSPVPTVPRETGLGVSGALLHFYRRSSKLSSPELCELADRPFGAWRTGLARAVCHAGTFQWCSQWPAAGLLPAWAAAGTARPPAGARSGEIRGRRERADERAVGSVRAPPAPPVGWVPDVAAGPRSQPGSAVSLRIPGHHVPDADSDRARLPGAW